MNESRLSELTQQWLQGDLTDAGFAELEQCLRSDPAARAAFVRAANLDSALRDLAARDDHTSAWLAPQPVPATPRKWVFSWGLAAAAVACLGASYFLGGFRPRPIHPAIEATAQGAAILTQTIDAAWSVGAPRQSATLAPGRLALQTGLAQIEFFSGAALVVAGPAEFEIVSPWKVVWHHGKARVKVPPAARGFELMTPGMKVIDLGTEFGVDVDRVSSGSRLHVFSGEIEAHPHTGAQLNLKEGQGLEQRGAVISISQFATLRPEDFPSVERVGDLGRERAQSQFERWQQFSRVQRQDTRLIAYYPMEPDSPGQRLVRNRAEPGDALRDGGAVGAAWGTGRWPQKGALEFKGAGDRVRLQLDGDYQALTLACWVRVDGLDRRYNALLLTDGYDPGEPHWQIYEDGRLMFSVTYEDPENPGRRRNQIYYSPVIFDRTNTGRWHHVAVTYDNRSGAAIQYVDGIEVSREVHRFHAPDRPVFFGPCELGNWGIPLTGHQFPIRNLNGRIDEFAIYSAVLGAEEIRAMVEAGRPE